MERPASMQRRAASLLAAPIFPSLYAWAATVAVPSLSPEVGLAARACAVLALAACVAAAVVLPRSSVWARRLGIYGFLAACVACWVLLGEQRAGGSPVRAVLGSLGWAAFAFGWGAVRQLGSVPEEHPAALLGLSLPARRALPWRSPAALVVGLVGATLCLVLPWRIERMPHAALGHLLGLATAGALLIVSGRLAVAPEGAAPRWYPPARRLQNAAVPLGLLGIFLAAGLVKLLLSEP